MCRVYDVGLIGEGRQPQCFDSVSLTDNRSVTCSSRCCIINCIVKLHIVRTYQSSTVSLCVVPGSVDCVPLAGYVKLLLQPHGVLLDELPLPIWLQVRVPLVPVYKSRPC